MNQEAMFYEKLDEGKVKCNLCPHHCIIKPGHQGICRCRENNQGRLLTRNYAEVAAIALDPIEKKPLYHFYPGSMILSVGTFGCNLSCAFCQNHTLAHGNPSSRTVEPQELVKLAERSRLEGSVGAAFTYNEPIIWYEYIYDTAALLKEKGLQVVIVTNGYIEQKPLQQLLPFVDAMNIDVKAFTEDFYRKNCKAGLKQVLETVECAASKCHVEVTNLVIPGENDDMEDIEKMAKWLAGINPAIPLHLSRYHPAYKFVTEATPAQTLNKARETAGRYLDYVFLGNIGGTDNNTYCLECENLLIKRNDYDTEIVGIQEGRCSSCGRELEYIKGG